jgi:dihydrofolate reductase
MRKLILQMQTSVDGYVSAQRDDLDWQVWNWGPDWTWDAQLKRDFNQIFAGIDTILLSSKMVEEGYLDHWSRAATDPDPDYAFARRIVEVGKVVATNRLTESRWPRTSIMAGDLAATVHELKERDGADIICFGGAGFAAALAARNLVDEFQLFVNPAGVGSGRSIFNCGALLELTSAQAYDCGIVVNRYAPRSGR